MAKKTVKKQPLKAPAKVVNKVKAKVTAKLVPSAMSKVAAKAPAKTAIKAAPKTAVKEKAGSKKGDKPSKSDLAPAAKKAADKKTKDIVPAVVDKSKAKEMAVKGKSKTAVKVAEPAAVEDESEGEVVSAETVVESATPEKVKVKKKTAAQKKKEKLDIDSNAKWADLFEKYKQVKPANYSMRDAFEANQPIQHKLLGWGWVMSSENDRLEVLFKDGKKILISNYKS